MHSAPAAASTPVCFSKPPRRAAGRRFRRLLAGRAQGARSRSQCVSTVSCFRICTAIISAGFRSCSLDGQFLARRERPLLIAGPPGTRARLDALLEVFFPTSTGNKWRFPWKVHGDRGRPSDRCAGPFGDDRGGRAFLGRALDRAARSPTARSCSPIRATPNGSRRWSRSPTAPISSWSSATAIPVG